MIRNRTLTGRRRSQLHREDINPLDGIVNLVDVMLVFACGLMLSIVMYWDVDLTKVTDVITKEEMVEVESLEDAIKDGTLFNDMDSKGIVYEDPETGKMYVIREK